MRRGGGGCRRQTGRKRGLSYAAPGCGQTTAASVVEWHTVRGQKGQAVCLERPISGGRGRGLSSMAL